MISGNKLVLGHLVSWRNVFASKYYTDSWCCNLLCRRLIGKFVRWFAHRTATQSTASLLQLHSLIIIIMVINLIPPVISLGTGSLFLTTNFLLIACWSIQLSVSEEESTTLIASIWRSLFLSSPPCNGFLPHRNWNRNHISPNRRSQK